jgi:hypothetical protein
VHGRGAGEVAQLAGIGCGNEDVFHTVDQSCSLQEQVAVLLLVRIS